MKESFIYSRPLHNSEWWVQNFKILIYVLIFLSPIYGYSQHFVVDNTLAGHLASFNGGTGMFITFEEENQRRGYLGSSSGNPEDVDFGTSNFNPGGELHLAIKAEPKLTLDNSGRLFIDKLSALGEGPVYAASSGALFKKKVQYLNLTPVDFKGHSNYKATIFSGVSADSITRTTVYGKVQLPQGAEILTIEITYTDNITSEGISVTLGQHNLTTNATNDLYSFFSTGSTAGTLTENSGFLGLDPIDNINYTYYMCVEITKILLLSLNHNISIINIQLGYTY